MGRLFWKFFLFIWLAQVAAMLGVGAVFWLEHRQVEARGVPPHDEGRPFARPPPQPGLPPPFPEGHHGQRFPPPEPGLHLPLLPFIGALLASLACAIALAWYVAKPIGRLRQAFEAAAEGKLEVRIGPGMGGREDELADLGRDFDRMTERLEALVNAQRHLLHDVSHEMRSPLARLQAAIGLARQQPVRMADSLERIERESERMNLLVGELLTLSRLDAGVIGHQETVDIGELLANIIEDARFEGAARHLQIDLQTGELPEIRANAELLHRAIDNIVRNAVRLSPDGATVRVEAGTVGKGFRLAVLDQGPGVPAVDLENIFQPFFRGGGQPADSGHGLGLAIAKRVVTMLNGKIRAENRLGGGLAVEVLLPQA
ncbi:MAG: ATP-binding protein [Azonexus sp.]